MSRPFRVIVTGSNRGIGSAICKLIASQHPNPSGRPLKLFAATRKGEPVLGPTSDGLVYPKLDISNNSQIQQFADRIFDDEGEVDVLINNAGVNLDHEYSLENAKKTLDVNYRGTLKMCQTLIPLLSDKGRIVNMSSVASQLRPYSEAVQQRFRDLDMTLEDLDELVHEYEHSVSTSTEQQSGFVGPKRAYAFSKSCVNALTRILSQMHPGLSINACCPGWVNTDMGVLVGSKTPPKTVDEGARIPVHLAFSEGVEGVTGRYWANDNIRSREVGRVQEW